VGKGAKPTTKELEIREKENTMAVDPWIPLSAFRNSPDLMEIASRASAIKDASQQRKLRQMQMDDYARKQKEEDAMRAAAAGAVTPASSQQVNMPGVNLPGYSAPVNVSDGSNGPQQSVSLPTNGFQLRGSRDTLNTAPSFDQNKYLANLAGNPNTAYQVPQVQAQQAATAQSQADARMKDEQTMIAIREGLGKLNAQDRAAFSGANEDVARAMYAVKSAPPEQKPAVYQQQLRTLASNPNPFVAKMVQGAPPQYDPQIEPQLDQWINHAMSISDIAKRVNPEPRKQVPGVDVPFSPDVEAQKVRISAASKSAHGGGPITPEQQNLIQQIGTGKMALGRMDYLLAKNPALLQAVSEQFPDFDSSKIKSYSDAYRSFTSGPDSKQVNAGAVAIQHLAELKQLNDDHSIAVRTPGTEAHNRFQNLLDTVADELVTFYGEPKTNEAMANKKKTLGALFNRDGAIEEQAKAMGVKFDELEQKWKNAAPSSAYQAPLPGVSQKAMQARAALDPEYAQRGNGGGNAGYVRIQASDGSLHDIPRQNIGAAQQRDPGLKVVQQ
jgi:hypothetical protein